MDDHTPDYGGEYHEGDDNYDDNYYYHYENEEEHTANDPESLQSYGEYDSDPSQSQGCFPDNDDNGNDYNAATDDMYDCHDKADHMPKPHEMVAFMCYRSISDRVTQLTLDNEGENARYKSCT